MFKTKKKKLQEECWNIDYELIKWVNQHYKKYLEDASETVDLTWKEFKYKRKMYTQEELIKKVITITDELLDYCEEGIYPQKAVELKDEMYDIMKELHFAMWW